MSTNCKKCGFANEPGSFFCESCGEKLPDVGTINTPEKSPFARPPVEKSDTDSTENGEIIVCLSCDNKNPSDSIFCENCGAKLSGPEVPARLINNNNGEVMHIMKEKNVFGRQDFVKWVPEEYDDPRISREHIRIDFDDGKYVLSLVKAQVNVTKLNGGPLAGGEVYDLKNKDEIDIASGRVVLTFEVDSDSTVSDKKTSEKSDKKTSEKSDKKTSEKSDKKTSEKSDKKTAEKKDETKASKEKSGDGDKSESKK